MAFPVTNSIPLSGSPFIDPLVQGSSWQFSGGPPTLTYSLSLNANSNGTFDPTGGTWAANTNLANAVALALTAWSNVANITFIQSGSGTPFNHSTADLAVTLTGNELENSAGAASLGIFPDSIVANSLLAAAGFTRATYPRPEGDVFLDNFSRVFDNTAPGGLGLQFIIHEIGHALGLKHPFDDGGNNRPTFEGEGLGVLDAVNYTVMSYSNNANASTTGAAATPMPLDILAIQSIYGANMSYHTGNDTYLLQNYDNTIWDAGGNNTLSASLRSDNVTIDLRPGYFSYGNSTPSVVTAIAYGVTIQNAVGGSGDDTLISNAAVDTLTGGAGNDTYVVNNSADVIIENPNAGTDTVMSSVSYALPANVENLTLTGTANISGTGNSVDNVIVGNAGDNVIDGGGGNDVLKGGLGNDTYIINSYAAALGPTSFQFSSQPGDFIGQGQSIAFNSSQGTFGILLVHTNGGGLVDAVQIQFLSTDHAHFWDFSFSTEQLGTALVPGTYLNAERFPFESAGHPGLTVSGEGRGANQDFGSFTVNAADFNYSGATPTINGLSISFVQHAESPTAPALTGTLDFNYSLAPPGTFPTVVENPNEGMDTVQTSLSGYVLPANVENLTLTGSANLAGTGNGLDNVLTSNTGVDTLTGGAGNDTYVVNNSADVIVENPSAGIDTVMSSVSYALPANVENLALTGMGNLNGTGNALDNVITGNSGNNTLTGGGGNDTIDGGWGYNTVDFSGSKSSYTVMNASGHVTVMGPDGTDMLTHIQDLHFADGDTLLPPLVHLSGPDLTGDGRADLVAQSATTGQLAIFSLNGTSLTGGTPYPFAVPGDWSVAGVGDISGDGQTDILWRIGSSNLVAEWTLHGGAVTGGTVYPYVMPSDWLVAGMGDINGDGKADILWRSSSTGQIAEWTLNGGSVTSGAVYPYMMGTDWSVAGLADINGDGKSDIVWHNDTNGQMAEWTLDGGTVTGGAVLPYVMGTDWSVAGVADINADHNADILWRNSSTGQVAEWTLNGSTVTGGAVYPYVMPGEWTVAGVGDLNGDHKADIIWHNDTTGQVADWTLDGANVTGGAVLANATPSDYHVL